MNHEPNYVSNRESRPGPKSAGISRVSWTVFGVCLAFFSSWNQACGCQQKETKAQDLLPVSMKLASKAVRASTVTVRVDREPTLRLLKQSGQQQQSQPENPEKTDGRKSPRSVAVFSGVLVKQGFVATPLFLPNSADPEVRITLPDGEQTIGRPRILDEYSGLAIISIKDHPIPCLKCCESSEPVVGDWVVSGAAWGRHEALVSLGMISGLGYRLPNSRAEAPPMIVCDLRAAQTSKGSGVVSANGKLIGIVMAVSNDQKWTYVVPASHIHRLLRSLAQYEKRPDTDPKDILVLKRQVPRLGVRIDSGDWNPDSRSYDIIVQSVATNGPADHAGLKKGDRIKSVNGKVVRACYDVGRDFLNHQPGDEISFGIIRDNQKLDVSVILGGGFSASGDNILKLKDYIKPEIELDKKDANPASGRSSRREHSQLVNYSIQNLAPTPCFDSDAFRVLLDALESERNRNTELKSRISDLEAKVDRLIEILEKK